MTSNKRYWDVTKTPLGKWWLTNESGWLCKWLCFNLMRELLFLTIVSKVTSAQFTPECIVGWLASGVAKILFFLRAFQTNAPNFLHATRGSCKFSMVLVSFVCVTFESTQSYLPNKISKLGWQWLRFIRKCFSVIKSISFTQVALMFWIQLLDLIFQSRLLNSHGWNFYKLNINYWNVVVWFFVCQEFVACFWISMFGASWNLRFGMVVIVFCDNKTFEIRCSNSVVDICLCNRILQIWYWCSASDCYEINRSWSWVTNFVSLGHSHIHVFLVCNNELFQSMFVDIFDLNANNDLK